MDKKRDGLLETVLEDEVISMKGYQPAELP
jgi:hypothetical protein